MLKPKWIILVICIVILSFGGIAWGDTAKQDETKKSIGPGGINKEMFQATSPWPNERCYADRHGRSVYQGPGTNPYEYNFIDLHTLGLEGTSGAWFGNLRVGPGNSIYFTYNVNLGERRVCSYNLTDGIVWQEKCEVGSDISLDGFGNVYYIDSAPPSPYHESAVGADRKLFWLNTKNSLTVFAPKLKLSPIFMEQEASGPKREVLK